MLPRARPVTMSWSVIGSGGLEWPPHSPSFAPRLAPDGLAASASCARGRSLWGCQWSGGLEWPPHSPSFAPRLAPDGLAASASCARGGSVGGCLWSGGLEWPPHSPSFAPRLAPDGLAASASCARGRSLWGCQWSGGLEWPPHSPSFASRLALDGLAASAVRPATCVRALLGCDRNDLAALPDDHDVVRVSQRVVLLAREGPPVGLDEPLVLAVEVLERVAHLRSVGGGGLLNGLCDQVQPVVGVGRADRGDHVAGLLDAVLLAEHAQDVLAALVLLPEEGVGLQERHPVGKVAGQLGEAAARDAPVGDHGRLPAELGPGAQHLRALRRIGDEHDVIGARALEPEQLRAHVGVVPVESLDAHGLDALLAEPLRQARLVGLPPRRVLEQEARLALLQHLGGVTREEPVDVVVIGRDAEDVVGALAVARDIGAGRPGAHVGHLELVPHGHLRQGHRRVQPPEDRHDLLALDELARDRDALLRIALVVADDELELAAAEDAALAIDLVDGDLQAALDGLARGGRAAGDRRREPDLDGLLGLGQRRVHRALHQGQQGREHHGEASHAKPPWRVWARVETDSRCARLLHDGTGAAGAPPRYHETSRKETAPH